MNESYARYSSMSDCDDHTECGSSVATVSNLDSLAAKSLRTKKRSAYSMGRSYVSDLRKQIKEMVGSTLEERESKASGRAAVVKSGPTRESLEMSRARRQKTRDDVVESRDQDDMTSTTQIGNCQWCQEPPSFAGMMNDLKEIYWPQVTN